MQQAECQMMFMSTTLSPGSYRVADWNDGRFLITAKNNVGPAAVNRVDLGFFPPSTDSRSDFWVVGTDGVKIMVNALAYVGGMAPSLSYSWTNNTPSIGLAASGTGNIASFTALNATNAPVTATITVTPTIGPILSQAIPTIVLNSPAGCTPMDIAYNPLLSLYYSVGGGSSSCNIKTFSSTGALLFNQSNSGHDWRGIWWNPATSKLEGNACAGCPANGIRIQDLNGSGYAINTGTTVLPPNQPNFQSQGDLDYANNEIIYYDNGIIYRKDRATGANLPNVNITGLPVPLSNLNPYLVGYSGNTGAEYMVYDWVVKAVYFISKASGAFVAKSQLPASTPSTGGFYQVGFANSQVWVNNGSGWNGYQITGPGGVTCNGPAKTFTITVNPTPTVNAVSNQTVCNGANTSAVNFSGFVSGAGMVYNWTNSNPAIGLVASGSGNIASFVAQNNGTSTISGTITVTPVYTNNGVSCSGTPITFTIWVSPTPNAVATPSAQTTCSGSAITPIVLSGNVGGNIIANGGFETGTLSSWTVLSATPAPVVNATNPHSGTYAAFLGSLNGGPEPFGDGSIYQTVTVPASGGVLTYWYQPFTTDGITFDWQDAYITNTSGTILATVMHVCQTGGWTQVNYNMSAFAGQTVRVVFLVHQDGFGDVTNMYVDDVQLGGTVYTWSRNNLVNVTGIPATGSGNITGTLTNNQATAQTVTFIITPTANGCSGAQTTATVTVNPIPTVNQPANQTVCNGANTAPVNFTGFVTPGTVYSWTNNQPSIGLAASGTGDIASFTAINTGFLPVVATITVTPSYTNGGVTCTGTPKSFTITVNPTPRLSTSPSNQVVCNGSATAAVILSTPAPGVYFTWTNNQPSIGLGAAGTGNIPSFIATNATNAPVVATITVTPVALTGCPGVPVSFTITVNPTPGVNAIANQSLCNGASTAPVTITGPVAGTVYSWTNNNTSIGLGASGTGNIGSFTAVNNTNAPVVATITVTPSYTNGGVSCTGTPVSFTITVNPVPTVNGVGNQTVCNGANTAAVNFTGSVGGTVYNWTNTNTAIGLASSGTGNIPSFTATNGTSAPISGTITVTPSVGGCTGTPTSFTITVNPSAQVNQPASQVVCAGTLTAPVNFTSPSAGVVFNWTNDNTTIGLAASGTGNIASFTAINPNLFAVVATITVTASYTVGGAGCAGSSKTFTITVNPGVNFITSLIPVRVCLSDTVVTLNALPAGGVWSGRGIITGTNRFDPAAAGVGVSLLTYTAPTSCGGTSSTFVNITVNDCKERHNIFAGAIRLFPNPTRGRFNIQFLTDVYHEFSLDVIDADGHIVYMKHFSGLVYGSVIPMDLSGLPSGMYVLNVHNDQERASFQLIIAH